MKKQPFTIIAVFIFLTSCKKSLQSFDPLDSGKIERKLTIKDVAKELNFTINPNVEGQILKQFGSVESWRTKIIDFRKSKESKKMAYKENRTTTDGDNTYFPLGL